MNQAGPLQTFIVGKFNYFLPIPYEETFLKYANEAKVECPASQALAAATIELDASSLHSFKKSYK